MLSPEGVGEFDSPVTDKVDTEKMAMDVTHISRYGIEKKICF